MHIIVLADESSKKEFSEKKTNAGAQITYIENLHEVANYQAADAFFILKDDINKKDLFFEGKPVFINSTIGTLENLKLPGNFIRINAWPTFLNREIWEIATTKEYLVKDIFEKLEWKYIVVADEPGLVSARIISMIINEAYFALGEDVSTKDEIDLAMKLGTNYPYGPFEWAKKIGLKKVHDLLKKLSETDARYTVAAAMENELN